MSKSRNQKLRILCLLNILRRETDTAHPMPVKDMLLQLEERGIRAERKAVYDDIRALVEYGIDIESIPGKGYYINTRDYELAELKTLADIILAAKFLTAKKSDHLIRKLCRETSKYSEAELNRQICVSRVKAPNETIYYTVDALHTAIRDNRQVSFRYYHFDENKNLIERRRNQQYVVSPWALLWDDENYYLISYSAEAKDIRHYRVDRMGNVDILRAQREGEERFHNFDAGVYGQKMFGMFGGEETIVTLRCKMKLPALLSTVSESSLHLSNEMTVLLTSRFAYLPAPSFSHGYSVWTALSALFRPTILSENFSIICKKFPLRTQPCRKTKSQESKRSMNSCSFFFDKFNITQHPQRCLLRAHHRPPLSPHPRSMRESKG